MKIFKGLTLHCFKGHPTNEESENNDTYYDELNNPIKNDHISLEYKKRAVEAFHRHPNHSFSTFQQKFKKCKDRSYINKWNKQIRMGEINVSPKLPITSFNMCILLIGASSFEILKKMMTIYLKDLKKQ